MGMHRGNDKLGGGGGKRRKGPRKEGGFAYTRKITGVENNGAFGGSTERRGFKI